MVKKRLVVVRQIDKWVLNRIFKLFAGRFLYSLIYHVGRRSGKAYSAPVVAALKDACVYIPLAYGADTDWYFNVKAAGNCRVRIKGRVYAVTQPEVIGVEAALPNFTPFFRKMVQWVKIPYWLRLKVTDHDVTGP